jgi:hypothetical protein
MDWICIASTGVPLTFNKYDWLDVFQGGIIAVGLVAFISIISALVVAWRAKRRTGPGGAGGDDRTSS